LADLERQEAEATQAATQDAPPLPPREWAEQHRRIDDRPFSLARHRPLWEPYNDDHPFQVYLKCAQVGVSEMAITKACHALDVGARYWETDKAGLNVAYLFPTGAALSDFSKERFSSLKSESPYLENLFADSPYDDVGFKQVGASYLYLRGTHSKKSLKSFPADVLLLDEFDEMDPTAVAMVDKRMRASVVRRKVALSTPMFPGVGIHALYLQSDQRVWEVHCPQCGAWNSLDFFRDVVADGEERETWATWPEERIRQAALATLCPSCREPIDRAGDGRWRPLRPDVTGIRGYHIPWYGFPTIDLPSLAVASVKTDPAQVAEFFRSDLGLPYAPAGGQITPAMLGQLSHALAGGQLPDGPWKQTTMGVDVGTRKHYRISSIGPDGARYVRAMGSVKRFDELDRLMERYQVRLCVIDAHPEQERCADWAKQWKGRVVRALYPNGLDGLLCRKKDAEQDEDGRPIPGTELVHINRTMAMDTVLARIEAAEERWPAAIHNDPEVIAHLTAPTRVTVKGRDGQERASWEHTRPDHLFHATVYDLIAAQILPKPTGGGLALGRAKDSRAR
jgi:hypothetical protein